MTGTTLSGGCQCGAVRFRAAEIGRPSVCHCRMCQKAFGGFFGPLVTCGAITWTRGGPKWFASSDSADREKCSSVPVRTIVLPARADGRIAAGVRLDRSTPTSASRAKVARPGAECRWACSVDAVMAPKSGRAGVWKRCRGRDGCGLIERRCARSN